VTYIGVQGKTHTSLVRLGVPGPVESDFPLATGVPFMLEGGSRGLSSKSLNVGLV